MKDTLRRLGLAVLRLLSNGTRDQSPADMLRTIGRRILMRRGWRKEGQGPPPATESYHPPGLGTATAVPLDDATRDHRITGQPGPPPGDVPPPKEPTP